MQVCKARKTIENLYETKANYNSISMRLGESVGRLTQVGSLGKSSEILKVRGDAVLFQRGFAVVS